MGIVEAKNLTFEYIRRDEEGNVEGITTAVDNVNIDIKAGDFVAVLGHNGSGKSTFAKHLNALVMPTEGTVYVDGMDTKDSGNTLSIRQTAGCGKKSTTKKLKTEDLDETTLQGMAKDITKEMSLKNKIGQLFMVSVYQLDEAESKNQTSVTSQMKKTLKKYPAGGVIMFAKNINTPDQTKKMTDELQDASYIPLLCNEF